MIFPGAWADTKKKVVDDKKNGIPIDSTKESGGHVAQVMDQFNGKNASKTEQAVEIDAGRHVASVVCLGGPDATTGNYHSCVRAIQHNRDSKLQGIRRFNRSK